MSNGWFRRGSDAPRMEALEQEVAALRATVAALGERVVTAEQDARQAALTVAAGQRRLAALARVLRAGGRRLDALTGAEKHRARHDKATDDAVTRLRMSLLAMGKRIDIDAAEARHTATALFQRIEARRALREDS